MTGVSTRIANAIPMSTAATATAGLATLSTAHVSPPLPAVLKTISATILSIARATRQTIAARETTGAITKNTAALATVPKNAALKTHGAQTARIVRLAEAARTAALVTHLLLTLRTAHAIRRTSVATARLGTIILIANATHL